MSIDRIRNILNLAVPTLFAQIDGGRIVCESEATLQLHLGRIIATIGDLAIVSPHETFSIELEKPLNGRAKRGRIDIWFRLRADEFEWTDGPNALRYMLVEIMPVREPTSG